MGEEFDTSNDTSDVATADVSNDIPADIPDNEPEDLANDTPDDIPEDIPEDEPGDVVDNIPEDISEDISEDVPEETSRDVIDDIPEDALEDTSEDESQELGDEVVENTFDDESGNLVDDVSEDIPENMSEDIQEDVSENISEYIQEDKSENVVEDIPDDIPEDMLEDKSEEESQELGDKIVENTSDDEPGNLVDDVSEDIPEIISEDIQKDEPKDTVADIPEDILEDKSEEESQELGDDVLKNTSDDELGNLVDNVTEDLLVEKRDEPENIMKDIYDEDVEIDKQVEDTQKEEFNDATESNDVEHESSDIYDEYAGKFFNERRLHRNYDAQSAQDAMDITHDEDISIKRYSGDGYRAINESLYNPEYVPSSEFKRQQIESDVSNITECLERKEIPYDSRIYRGVNDMRSIFGDDFKNMSIGELNRKYSGTYFENKGFTSASTSEKVAERFANSWNGGLLSIEVPKGAKGMCIGDVSLYKKGENEVLLQRGTMYRINSVGMRNRQIHVDTTAIGC